MEEKNVFFDRKFVFLSGKGGVGKTTTSSSIAMGLSKRGHKTLLISTDPSHSIGHIFEKEIGPKERQIRENLYGIEINVKEESRKYIDGILKQAKEILSPVILEEVKDQIELAYHSPGAEELALFDVISRFFAVEEKYDNFVFDTAPSGYTLRLLALPKALNNWINRLIKTRINSMKVEYYATRNPDKKLKQKLEEDPVLKILYKRKEQFELARKILLNSEKTLFMFVLNPERLPIEITRDSIKELEENKIKIEALIINKITSDSSPRSKKEAEYIKEIEKEFAPRRIFKLPLMPEEVHGISSIEKISDILFSQ